MTDRRSAFTTVTRQISKITGTEMKEKGSQTLAEALSAIPGVSQLTTGAISKPVIRGLYGNRIQVIIAGIRLEDQQWEDEYGLGLSDIGVARVELIKGPASLLFGPNAMGGVVNVVEEGIEADTPERHNLNLKLFTNTYGAGVDYGFKKPGKNDLIFRAGLESHADYSDGSGERVPNTRFALYNIKLGYIIDRSRFRSENRLLTSFNEFGFIADSADLSEDKEEPRLSREFEEAHQKVFSALFSSLNTFSLNSTTDLELNLGFQNNLRSEQERAEEENLDLSLNTFTIATRLNKKLNEQWTFINGISGMYQVNTNHGTRIIVPDASITDGSVLSYVRYRHSGSLVKGNFETGLRFDHRQIITHETGLLNPASGQFPPFKKPFNDITGSIGESLTIKNFVLKFNLSSGFRSGNLSELSANGLHEGTLLWYIGNPGMKSEKCLNADVSASWQYKWISLRGSVFNNWFRDFIFLQPTDEYISGYRIFRYMQTDARLKGFETGISIEKSSCFSISADYSFLDARESDGSWLPMIPANRFLIEGKYYLPAFTDNWQSAFISTGINISMSQKKTGLNESSTPEYYVINLGMGINYKSLKILLTCRNLTGEKYYDHLSRLKYYGLYDMGRNIVLNLGWQF